MTDLYQILHIVALSLQICPRRVLIFELDPKWRPSAAISDLLKALTSPARLGGIPQNFAGRRVKGIVYIICVKRCDQMHFRDRCDQMHFRDRCDHMHFRIHLVTQSS